jgi:hypothetical protein
MNDGEEFAAVRFQLHVTRCAVERSEPDTTFRLFGQHAQPGWRDEKCFGRAGEIVMLGRETNEAPRGESASRKPLDCHRAQKMRRSGRLIRRHLTIKSVCRNTAHQPFTREQAARKRRFAVLGVGHAGPRRRNV